MTSSRYIILLISSFFYLFIFAAILLGLVTVFDLKVTAYLETIQLVAVIYFSMALSISSYLVARVFFLADKKIISQRFFIGFLSFFYLFIMYLLYDVYANTHNEKTEQYAIVSFILVSTLVAIPVLLARPNKFFLKLIAKIFREF